MAIISTIVISNNHLDWIRRNPDVFVNGLVSRLEQGETDPYPGHARWNGDGLQGVQFVHSGHSSSQAVILVHGGAGKCVVTTSEGGPHPGDVDALKAFAHRMGYTIRKKNQASSVAGRQARGGDRPRAPDLRNKEAVNAGLNKNPFNGEESTVLHLTDPKPANNNNSRTQRASKRKRLPRNKKHPRTAH